MDQHIEAIKLAASDKYTPDEIDSFINMEKRLTSKPVLYALMEVIKEGSSKGFNKKKSESLCQNVLEKLQYNECGYISLTFKETSYILGVSLTLVEKNYRTDVNIPSEDYVKDLYEKYDLLKQCAAAFWGKFCIENPELLKDIAEYRKDVDFSSLKVDAENPTTMYFDPESKMRVGIGCFYIGPDNQVYYKKSK